MSRRPWGVSGLAALAALAATAWPRAMASPAADPGEPPALRWSLGLRLAFDDRPGAPTAQLRPMLGLRYGRWRTGPVDGERWHRLETVRSDTNLQYDWLDTGHWRTSLSASVVHLDRDSAWGAFAAGRKTLRARATVDHLLGAHWSTGVVLTQDLLQRGGGGSLSPHLSWRWNLDTERSVMLSQSLTWADAPFWATEQRTQPQGLYPQGSGWGHQERWLLYRQRLRPQVSWFAQLQWRRSLAAAPVGGEVERTAWLGQLGVVYFAR